MGFFLPDPAAGGSVLIAAQSGQFAVGIYTNVGRYEIDLVPIPGLISVDQMFPQATLTEGLQTDSATVMARATFVAGHGRILVEIGQIANILNADRPFYLSVFIRGI